MRHLTICLTLVAALVATAWLAPAVDAHTLRWGQGKRAALRVANSFPIVWDGRKVDWCNRWSRHEIHCGVSAWATEYDEYIGETRGDECSATAIVKLRRGSNRPRVRKTDQSCFYA